MKKYIDLKLLKYLTIFYTVYVLVNLSRKVYLKLNGIRFEHVSWRRLLTYNIFMDWVTVLVFMVIMSYWTKRMFERGFHWKYVVAIHVFCSFLIGYFVFFFSGLTGVIFGDISFEKLFTQTVSFQHFMFVIELNFLIYFAMIGIINVYYYIKKVKNIELRAAQLQTHLATTKLSVLKAQLHPHFIFNTLNSISSLIEIDPEKSQNLVADFGDLFREILELKDENTIPLKQELNLLNKYIDIILVRFSDHLVIKQHIEEGMEEAQLPNMILQPLVENSVKHGYSYQKTQLNIHLSVFKKDGFLHIEIENDGAPLTASFEDLLEKGMGLSNTQGRLQTLYGTRYKFEIKNKEDDAKGVLTKVCIPFSTEKYPQSDNSF